MLCECGHDVELDEAVPITSADGELVQVRLVKGNRPIVRLVRMVDPPPFYICVHCLFPNGMPPGAA